MDGTRFKYTVSYLPYFLICVKESHCDEALLFLKNKYGAEVAYIEKVYKDDLDLPNHLTGLKQLFLKLSFYNQNVLAKVRKIITLAVRNNTERFKNQSVYEMLRKNIYSKSFEVSKSLDKRNDPLDFIYDIREHDVPYHVRVSIDLKIFCGMWYKIEITGKNKLFPAIKQQPDILERPEPVVLAFDIETTKLPLKFPDAQTDQIIMISYMIDGLGYLITNREIISTDVKNFEYTPKPEFEGYFEVFNERNEKCVIQKFFNHVMQVCPLIFVTYNGDFFDWPFIEMRASLHNLKMSEEIGFSKTRDGTYLCRPAIHMDCLCWVKRDSYLPVGSQGLKAVAKAKLRYDPIELDPEEMCKMAVEQPQVLSNYSVSDAIATYYLYMKYVHPFVFALNTIIPMEPDEVLRKGSGTLCETLLMVEAFHANIVFPNKQQNEMNKLSNEGHLLDSETYVGGHVEALECGVYRADIPCRFRLDRNMITQLIENIDKVLEHAITGEENVPLKDVTNLSDVSAEIKTALQGLYDIPNRLEQPVIYHLDVGAMYPNIILTNRLQPSAVVNDSDCAACDFNFPDEKCKRQLKWHWRGEMLPASKNELQRIKQQLEMEKFPPIQVGGNHRSFNELSKEDQAGYEKKRLLDYCRKVYKKTKVVKLEERVSTICQKENSFYVDTVRAFRDRRYDYKGLTKVAKKAVQEALQSGDAAEIKSAKSKEVLYDSLQLAHKCILNSFYGYVMRKGARWHSMPMAGIVCLTGSNIIKKARIIIERIGRPLELDTDGIWCILPASFPQVLTIHSKQKGKSSFNISYPNAVLNTMVKDHFTNDQYHELTKTKSENDIQKYQIRSENSIFFEVDGPYLAMILPAAKEEGKKLKKRYAVFNFDGTLAELKGFEVKRRGELQLIKNFQSSVFESFLSGSTLEDCYASVAKIADYWLDVLYSHGQNLPDSELFELVSENRSMSKKLEDYGAQKSTSISTAKRLAEFLGDQMIKDAGLSCKYVISKKPEGSPVTERAIPLAIFQCEPSIRRCYLRRWLRDTTMGDADIREVLDWNYYIERLSGAIQKIITIPAAMQGLKNPVPRVSHPDWLHKKMTANTDTLKQRQISELFMPAKQKRGASNQINKLNYESLENIQNKTISTKVFPKKRKLIKTKVRNFAWKNLLGSPPLIGDTREQIVKWILYQKEKWNLQINQKRENTQTIKRLRLSSRKNFAPKTVSEFLTRSKQNILDQLWHVISLTPIDSLGNFIVWVIIENELHKIKLNIPRILYVNQRSETGKEIPFHREKVNCILPRSTQSYFVYKYNFQEKNFKRNGLSLIVNELMNDIEGIYETNVSLEYRFLIEIGCLCSIQKSIPNKSDLDVYSFDQLKSHTDVNVYLRKSWKKLRKLFLYQHNSFGNRQIWGLFLPANKYAVIVVLDKVRANQMPNMNILYYSEREAYIKKIMESENDIEAILPAEILFEVFMEVDLVQVYRHIQRTLEKYRENKNGPTILCEQTSVETANLKNSIPSLSDFPLIKIHISDDASTLHGLNWQKQITRSMVRHFLNFNNVIDLMFEQSRYLNIPIGNVPSDPVLIGTDIFYARLLQKNNCILWWSSTNRPDLGGKEAEDYKLLREDDKNMVYIQNNPGFYKGICVALALQNLTISALMQSNKVLESEGGYFASDFNSQATLQEMLVPEANRIQTHTDFSLCGQAFRTLRTMVNGWLREVSLNKNVFSDYHIAHFYRWLDSSNAFLYDPAIRKVLIFLMNKIFIAILSEFKNLGVVIIYADFTRIIIDSKRKTVIEALGYVEFIVQSIRKKELFHSIQLSFDQSWSNLVWLSYTDYAGIKVFIPSEENVLNSPSTDDISNLLDIQFSLRFSISTEEKFRLKFEELLGLLLQSLQEKQSVLETLPCISHKIFELSTNLHKKYSHIHRTSVSKFVHLVIKLFSIEDSQNKELIIFRKNLLKAVGVNEFSEDEKLVLNNTFALNSVACKACNEFRDIDLLNDKHKALRNGRVVWLCNQCFVPYDTREIETLISEAITSRLVSYTLQDFKCSQCNTIKNDNFCEMCPCGGRCAPLFNQKDLRRTVTTVLRVATIHQMNVLQHLLKRLLR